MIIVEDGSIVDNANSYVTVAELQAYAAARGITIELDEEHLLIRAMDYIESLEFIGYRVQFDQELSWPRQEVWIDGFPLAFNVIPKQLKNAQMSLALEIDAGLDPMQPAPRKTIREKVDVIEVQYSESGSSQPMARSYLIHLQKLLAGGGGLNNIRVSRG
jgi:hypothetical protein